MDQTWLFAWASLQTPRLVDILKIVLTQTTFRFSVEHRLPKVRVGGWKMLEFLDRLWVLAVETSLEVRFIFAGKNQQIGPHVSQQLLWCGMFRCNCTWMLLHKFLVSPKTCCFPWEWWWISRNRLQGLLTWVQVQVWTPLRCISDLVSDLMLLHRDGLLGVLHHVPKLCECLLDRGGFRGNVVFGTWWDFFFLSQESLDGWCDRLITSPIDFQTYGVPPSLNGQEMERRFLVILASCWVWSLEPGNLRVETSSFGCHLVGFWLLEGWTCCFKQFVGSLRFWPWIYICTPWKLRWLAGKSPVFSRRYIFHFKGLCFSIVIRLMGSKDRWWSGCQVVWNLAFIVYATFRKRCLGTNWQQNPLKVKLNPQPNWSEV